MIAMRNPAGSRGGVRVPPKLFTSTQINRPRLVLAKERRRDSTYPTLWVIRVISAKRNPPGSRGGVRSSPELFTSPQSELPRLVLAKKWRRESRYPIT